MRTMIGTVALSALLVLAQGVYAQQGLQAEVLTCQVQKGQAGPHTDVFQEGQTIGALAIWKRVPAEYHLSRIWVKLEGKRGTPVVQPVDFSAGAQNEGNVSLFTLHNPPAGSYEVVIVSVAPDQSTRVVATHKFQVVGAQGSAPPLPNPSEAARPRALFRSGSQELLAIPLATFHSPQGFSIDVPSGWSPRPVQGTGILVTPPGQGTPSILIYPGFRVSDVRYSVMIQRCTAQTARNPLFGSGVFSGCIEPSLRAQLADSSHPWSPEEAARLVTRTLSNGQTRGTPTVTPVSRTAARYTVGMAGKSGPAQDWGYIDMSYLPNPVLTQRSVVSLAFLSACEASPDQAERFGPVCAGVLSSFRPGPEFARRLTEQISQLYEEEFQILLKIRFNILRGFQIREDMITRHGAIMQQMQQELFDHFQQANLHNGENWIATLGHNVWLCDPATGMKYLEPDGYGSYGVTASGDTVLMGDNIKPGKWVTDPSAPADRMLQRCAPP